MEKGKGRMAEAEEQRQRQRMTRKPEEERDYNWGREQGMVLADIRRDTQIPLRNFLCIFWVHLIMAFPFFV